SFPVPFLCWLSNGAIKERSFVRNLQRSNKEQKKTFRTNANGDVRYSSLPESFKSKYCLPKIDAMQAAYDVWISLANEDNIVNPEDSNADRIYKLTEDLANCKTNDFIQHYNAFKAKYSIQSDKCREFAQKAAVWSFIVDYY